MLLLLLYTAYKQADKARLYVMQQELSRIQYRQQVELFGELLTLSPKAAMVASRHTHNYRHRLCQRQHLIPVEITAMTPHVRVTLSSRKCSLLYPRHRITNVQRTSLLHHSNNDHNVPRCRNSSNPSPKGPSRSPRTYVHRTNYTIDLLHLHFHPQLPRIYSKRPRCISRLVDSSAAFQTPCNLRLSGVRTCFNIHLQPKRFKRPCNTEICTSSTFIYVRVRSSFVYTNDSSTLETTTNLTTHNTYCA
jgi:hypothetical protein